MIVKINPRSRWKMSQIQSHHEILHGNAIELKEKSLVHEAEAFHRR